MGHGHCGQCKTRGLVLLDHINVFSGVQQYKSIYGFLTVGELHCEATILMMSVPQEQQCWCWGRRRPAKQKIPNHSPQSLTQASQRPTLCHLSGASPSPSLLLAKQPPYCWPGFSNWLGPVYFKYLHFHNHNSRRSQRIVRRKFRRMMWSLGIGN